MLVIKLGLQVASSYHTYDKTVTASHQPLWLQQHDCDCSSMTMTAVVRLWPEEDIKPQILKACLHFPYSAQNMNHDLAHVVKFLLSPWGSCQWPSLAIIQYRHLVPQQADSLRHLQFSGIWITPLFLAVQPV